MSIPLRPESVETERERVDTLWMQRALEEAYAAKAIGEVPVGAVIVRDGQIIAEAHNETRSRNDPTAHAEILAIRRAAKRLQHWWLHDTTLYVTLEPCAMCAGAIVLARISRLIYAAPDPKSGMAGSLASIVQDPRLNHRVDLRSGVLARESGQLLRDFFASRR